MRIRRIIGALALLLGATGASAALIDFTGGRTELNTNAETYGYSFSVSGMGYVINGLGVFDSLANPLVGSHAVGLWNSSGNLITSTTVGPKGTIMASTDTLGQWLETDIAAVTLAAGTYFVGVYYPKGSDYVLDGSAVPQSAAGLTYLSSQFNFGDSLAFPGSTFGDVALVGPALFGTPVTASASGVPEPGTWALLLAGVGAIGFGARRSRARSSSCGRKSVAGFDLQPGRLPAFA